MKVSSWENVEEQVHRALALEVVSRAFPPVASDSLRGLDHDADRLAAAIRALPVEFNEIDLRDSIAKARLKLSYRDSLVQTLAHLVSMNYVASSELVGV